jgi:hypothetical protein
LGLAQVHSRREALTNVQQASATRQGARVPETPFHDPWCTAAPRGLPGRVATARRDNARLDRTFRALPVLTPFPQPHKHVADYKPAPLSPRRSAGNTVNTFVPLLHGSDPRAAADIVRENGQPFKLPARRVSPGEVPKDAGDEQNPTCPWASCRLLNSASAWAAPCSHSLKPECRSLFPDAPVSCPNSSSERSGPTSDTTEKIPGPTQGQRAHRSGVTEHPTPLRRRGAPS